MDSNFLRGQIVQTSALALIGYGMGLLVQLMNAKVNYTRKVIFFALYALPIAVARLMPYQRTFETTMLSSLIAAATLCVFLKPIRERVGLVQTVFSSFDRPEDRPHTLLWLSTQIVAGYAVLIPMSIVFARYGMPELMMVPILIHGIGDGLAEPIGIRFGRHKYSTRTFLSRARRHTRSYEGSAWVLATGLIAVAIFRNSFTSTQFVAGLLTIPMLSTLAEAWSPHTWDTPYMFLTGCLSLLAVKLWI